MEPGGRPIPGAVATAGVDERMAFVRRTYLHLAAAVAALVVVEYLLMRSGVAAVLVPLAFSGANWLIVLGGFMFIGWLAQRWAYSDTSPAMQYLGLGLYVLSEAFILLPLLHVAAVYGGPGVIPTAALATVTLFGGLTGTVFLLRKDFTFLRGALSLASFAALGVIVVSLLFGFSLGAFFSVLMIGLAAGYVLYYTSAIMAHFRPTQHVAASLALFATVALMFWYILRLLMSLRE
jgi:hypothetical protein